MKNNSKIPAIAFIISLCFVFYLIVTAEPVKKENQINKQANAEKGLISEKEPKVTNINLEENYKQKTPQIIKELFEKKDLTLEDLQATRDELLELKVPVEMKKLHLDLVMSLTNYEKYFTENNNDYKKRSLEKLSELKANNHWLEF